MAFYLRTPGGSHRQLWRIDDVSAEQIGTSRVGHTYFEASPGVSVWDDIRNRTPWFEPDGENPFVRLQLEADQYYPRIARPLGNNAGPQALWCPGASVDQNMIASARSQAEGLTAQLGRVCRTIHPCPETFSTYGHDIRNLLILASTEVEMSCRGVLRVNGSTKTRLSMNEYVALADVMGLRDFAVRFPTFPWLDPIRPFENWLSTDPTRSLGWYDAYNGVKHNREHEFEKATLKHAFEAVSACVILLVAQFGRASGVISGVDLGAFFAIDQEPQWPVETAYFGPLAGWTPVNHPTLFAYQ